MQFELKIMNKMMIMKKAYISIYVLCFFLLFIENRAVGFDFNDGEGIWRSSLVKKEERRAISSSENGEVTGVSVNDGRNGTYFLQFITMEPNSLFLPVLLHSDMLFYVQSGSGRLSYIGEEDHEDETIRLDLQRGDVYRLKYGSVFFIESNLENERRKLRISSIFATSNDEIRLPSTGPYSSIRDMLLGFDENILQAAFKVPEEVIEELKSGMTQPLIVHRETKSTKSFWEAEAQFINGLMHRKYSNMFDITSNKKHKTKLFNLLSEDRDVENCNGWSTAVTSKKLKALKNSDMGIFMVNLTKGSMMGPHWNPRATEIAIVVRGQGMVRVVCSTGKECKNKIFRAVEGDVFVVPRFHPMAQMSFNNDTFVFVGFSTSAKKNHPQFLVGKSSVLQTLDRDILAMSFNVFNTTFDRLLAMQNESVILECTSCAEEEERKMEEEVEKEREEEEKEREERKREEEEEARRKEEEEARQKEEEARRKEEERRKKEEEEARQREEEKRRREEEEERRREEEAEEEARREHEEEEASRQEEEKRRREEEEEEEARRESEEEEAEATRRREEGRRGREEEKARRQEEEKRRREEEEEEEEARKEEKSEATGRREGEEARRGREEEKARRQEEEKRRREEEEEEEARKEEESEATGRREEGEAKARREREEEEDQRRRERAKEEAQRREEEGQEEETEAGRREEQQREEGERTKGRTRREEEAREEEEAARRQEEEMEREQGGGKRGEFIKIG